MAAKTGYSFVPWSAR